MTKRDPQVKEITDAALAKSGAKVKVTGDGYVSGPPEEYFKFLKDVSPDGKPLPQFHALAKLLVPQAVQEFLNIEIHGLSCLQDFITEDEATALIAQIDRQPWLTDLKRRVQHYGYKYDYKARAVTSDAYLGPLLDWLQTLCHRLHEKEVFSALPDQVIVNEYMPGQGISRYDDGGFSGGSMERPAVKRLIQDIEDGLIDVVVVYKIDRLSRSMADFMKIMELFDKQKVSFVSVTQHFNTDTSMGRLTLNILQSFAQFEREMTAERIRDKFAASKRKGMWMGGVPPLGYDVHNRKLEINPDEAEIVQFIYKRFLEMGSATQLVGELEERGYQSKSWVAKSGRFHPGKPITKSSIYKILDNPVYIGKISHKGTIYEGEHVGFIDPADFEKAKEIRETRAPNSSPLRCTQAQYLLRGLVFDAEGYTFTCAAVKKAGKRYKYYVSTQAVKKSYDDCPIKTLSAPLLEGVIIEQMRRILTRPEWSKSVLVKVKELLNDNSPDDTKIVQTLQNFDLLWDELFPLEQQRLAKLIIQKVVVYPEKVIIALRPLGMPGLLHEMMPDAKIKKGQPTENTPLEITIPIKFKKHGGRKYITTPDGRDLSVARRPKYENNMIKAIGRGHQYLEMLEAEPDLTIMKLAEREMLDHGYIAKTVRMTQLAPDIIEAILNGRQPYSLNLTDFMKPFPNGWEEQRQHFGF